MSKTWTLSKTWTMSKTCLSIKLLLDKVSIVNRGELQYDQKMMEPQLISSCPLSELFFEEEEDLMGSEISRIYFPTRKRDRTTISHEIHCEIILKRDTGIHGPLIWSEFPEENEGSTDGRISPKKGHHHGPPISSEFSKENGGSTNGRISP